MNQNSGKNRVILFLIVFLDMMGFSIIFPIFPEILQFFNSKGHDYTLDIFIKIAHYITPSHDSKVIIVLLGGISGSIYSFLQFVFAPLWGKISDSEGRKPVLIFTSIGNLLGYIVWLFSGNFTMFVLSRIITGSMGGNISVASASMADSTSIQDRAKGMGMIGAGIGLGFIFGPPIGGFLSKYELSSVFYFLSPVLTKFSMSAFFSVLVAAMNILLLIFLFHETKEKIKTQTKKVHPLLEINNIQNKKLITIALVYFLFMFSFSGFEFVLNFFLSEIYNFSPENIGMTFVFIGIIIIFIQGGIIRRISGKVSEINICIFGAISLIIGFSILIFIPVLSFVFFAFALLATGSAFLNPGFTSLASINARLEEQGKSLGVIRSFGSLARAISPITFCLIYFLNGAYFSFTVSFMITIVFFVLLLVMRYKYTEQTNL
ncbi:MAG: MFS transporter [Leptospiraceae bacterium]|nr:MFS transporter [Leptospiraceae bacterium]MCK6379915.1 MFS transporter [Leptospiraceae bacterium]NUM40145.1 MFS transporter [Leptospiraceae bacterium]